VTRGGRVNFTLNLHDVNYGRPQRYIARQCYKPMPLLPAGREVPGHKRNEWGVWGSCSPQPLYFLLFCHFRAGAIL